MRNLARSSALVAFAALAFAALAAVACDDAPVSDSSTSARPDEQDASAESETSADAGTSDDATCKGITATGGAISLVAVTDAAPTASGGNIADGTYLLTAATVYGGPATTAFVKLKVTLQIAGPRWTRGYSFDVSVGDAGSGGESTGSDGGTFTTAGAELSATKTCTDGSSDNGFGGFTGGYTASGSTLTLVQDALSGIQGATKIAYVFERQ